MQRALALQGLEVETRVRGHLALAEVLLLMGQNEAARGEATRALEEAHRFELAGMLKDCEQPPGEDRELAPHLTILRRATTIWLVLRIKNHNKKIYHPSHL